MIITTVEQCDGRQGRRPDRREKAELMGVGLVLPWATQLPANREWLGVGEDRVVRIHRNGLVGDVSPTLTQRADQRGLAGAATSYERHGGAGGGVLDAGGMEHDEAA